MSVMKYNGLLFIFVGTIIYLRSSFLEAYQSALVEALILAFGIALMSLSQIVDSNKDV